MDIPTSNNMTFSLLLMSTCFLVFFIVKIYSKSKKNLPPGPVPWPIIGNLHQIGKNPHVSTAMMAQKYGPLISLRLGTQVLVVASSPDAALGILKNQDRFLSSRFVPNSFQIPNLLPFSLIWSPDCDDNWRSLRSMCRTEMFSAKALESQTSLRDEKLRQMLDFLCSKEGQVINIEEVVFTTIFNTLSNIFFGKDFFDLKDEHGTAGGLKMKLFETLQNAVIPNVSDFFPMLERLDLQGLRKETLKHVKEIFTSWEGIINERRLVSVAGGKQCFIDRLLENGFSNDQINMLALELFTAGTDTTTSTVEWAMAELIKNKKVMSKVQEELRNKINPNNIVESELSILPYLNACIKETLRLHPPAPFLLPHRAIQSCEVLNYTIPYGAQIFTNIWAIGRDPKLWEDPLLFKPERFIGSSLDFRGRDFEFLPFGAGRRMCPGLPSGIKSIQSILASLILRFEWALPNGEDPTKLNMDEKFGVILQKEQHLQLILKQLT